MLHRFYDIKVENENLQEISLSEEYVLDVPEQDMSTPLDRQEYLDKMFDIITTASGLNICSFSTDCNIS